MKRIYTQPHSEETNVALQQILCGSGGWAEIGDYGSNTGGGFIQE